ncbi:FAD-dependent monooxygenase [Sagittula stellata]|uniref:Monooxygenase, FAD-binding protein n=1 Tax=Sagittula stellata (strain ATCC 700073 / DSM 11524 / E-37) TaxID=388399 RepID=A3K482_SAGS3|nr:FAD-dependent monooxygenase [Sagittula stellata]EBA07781.1 monooxygenase, FAD-binding protein [Sagittula stellata E-37]
MEQIAQQDVIIVGGGPVGNGLAIDLGQKGLSVLVIEKYDSPQPIPKGQNLTQRTMEHFAAWGAEEALRAAKTVPSEFGIGGLTAYGTLLGDYSYDWLKRELVRPYYAADNERLPQYATEAVLRARAAEIGTLRMVTGRTVEDITEDEDGVTVTARRRDGSGTETHRAAWCVGADGSRSVVREKAGLGQTVFDHDRLMVLLVFQSDDLHERLIERHPGKSFVNVLHPDLEGYWLFFGRVDLEGEFFFHAPVPAGADPETFDFEGFVQRAVGAPVDIEIRHRGFWDCRVAIAESYGRGRVFIAGDAAHNHPPYGGYGINSGFEDSRNLGWKLAAVHHGWGGENLLATYDEERRPVFWSTAKDFIERSIEVDRDFLARFDPEKDRTAFEAEWTARGSGAQTEVGSFQPNYRGSSIVDGPRDGTADAVAPHAFTARPGFHLAPRKLDGQATYYDSATQGFTLIAAERSEETIEFERAAKDLNVPLETLQADPTGEFADYGARLILVRPDSFVAWVGDNLGGSSAADIMALATGRGAV